MSHQRYHFTTAAWGNDELKTRNDAPGSSSFILHRSSFPTTVPWYWAAVAFALGGLAGVAFLLTLLLVLTV